MASSAVDRFIEEMGLISQEGGGPRIAGRILGLLIVEGRELSLNQISERLGVSRASVSTNSRLLVDRGILRLRAHGGDRQNYYELPPVPYSHLLLQMSGQFEKYATMIGACAAQIEAEPDGAEAAHRVQDLASFYRQSSEFLNIWFAHLRDQNPTHQG